MAKGRNEEDMCCALIEGESLTITRKASFVCAELAEALLVVRYIMKYVVNVSIKKRPRLFLN